MKVNKIEKVYNLGLHAPLTESGMIVVDNIVSSCFTEALINEDLTYFFLPVYKKILQIQEYFNPSTVVALQNRLPDDIEFPVPGSLTEKFWFHTMAYNMKRFTLWLNY